MIKAAILSIRQQRRVGRNGGRNLTTTPKNPLLAALHKSKRVPPRKIESLPTKRMPAKSLSFFDEVDYFLEKDKPEGNPGSINYSTRNSTQHATNATSSARPASQKWTSVLGKDGSSSSTRKSIFDVFKVPEPAPQRSQFAYDLDAHDEYIAILDGTRESVTKLTEDIRASVEKWLRLDEPKIGTTLSVFTEFCEKGNEAMVNQEKTKKGLTQLKKKAEAELSNQATHFQKELGWNKQQYTYALHMLHEIADSSCNRHKALPVAVIFEKMKEIGTFEERTLARCLQASASFSGGSLSRGRSILGTPLSSKNRLYDILEGKESRKEFNDADEDKANVPEQLASANDLFYKATHHSTTIRTKRLISLGNADGALKLVESNTKGEVKLRAYSQVFHLFLELGQINSAMVLLEKMKKKHDIVPVEPEMFVQLIAAIAENGFFCHGAEMIGSASGPALLDQLAGEMSDYVSTISSASAKRLQKAFRRGFEGHGPADGDVISALAPLRPLEAEEVPERVLIADRVTVEASTGFCSSSNVSLRLIGLDSRQKNEMKDSLVKLVRSRYGRQQNKGNRQAEALVSFWVAMRNRTGRPFTVIIDGANVAYYMQNFDRGKFNFHQIEFAVTALEGIGEHPLVVLPRRYEDDSFNVAIGEKKQRSSAAEKSILKGLRESGKLYLVPQGCLDDYFWLLASVSDQSNCQSKDSQSGDTRKWPGARPVVMTNDQIRDHMEFQFLGPRLFNRWYSSTIMNYNFTGFVGDECIDPEIAFTPADMYSREIQGNTARVNAKIDGATWHLPVQDWDDWFCIRLPTREPKER